MSDNPTREECEAILKLDVELLRHFRPDEIQNLIKSHLALLDECENLRRDKERLDWLESNAPISLERVLDMRRQATNRITTWIFGKHTEKFSRPVTHPPLREAIDDAISENAAPQTSAESKT